MWVSRRSRHFIHDLAMILDGKTGTFPGRKTGSWPRP
jgi:hypothetical protein